MRYSILMNWPKSILPRSFYNRNPKVVARALLGKYLVRKIDGIFLVGKIVETEAYLSSGDSAAHNFKGKTNRNKSLYKDAGHAYVHSMRQYHLLDVVVEGEEIPGSVLIRGIEPVQGIEEMKKFRHKKELENLTNGPGKVCDAFRITKELDGIDMTNLKSGLFISDGVTVSKGKIKVSSRIGISTAKESLLRFWIVDNQFVSRAF